MPWNIKWTGQICIDVNELRIAISMQWSFILYLKTTEIGKSTENLLDV